LVVLTCTDTCICFSREMAFTLIFSGKGEGWRVISLFVTRPLFLTLCRHMQPVLFLCKIVFPRNTLEEYQSFLIVEKPWLPPTAIQLWRIKYLVIVCVYSKGLGHGSYLLQAIGVIRHHFAFVLIKMSLSLLECGMFGD